MPICPGCERQVPYRRLGVHQRYCEGIGGTHRGAGAGAATELLDERLTRIEERVEERLGELERRLALAERIGEDLPTTSGE